MVVNYVNWIPIGLAVLTYVVLNILVVYYYTIPFMWQEFWVNQKWFGKICDNLFYLPAWIIKFVLVALVCVLNFIFVPLFKIFKAIAKWINPVYKQAIKLNI